uniref:Uncharacterized protein orf69a n=1 Tax=Chara vulgaris TaxID=55564 RepID=Q1ACK3_CHAVU|nr:hypothetical protein ChvuCp041 [Chara vulgaris]ABA61991.1 hypothetical protein [Chara vulgaris]
MKDKCTFNEIKYSILTQIFSCVSLFYVFLFNLIFDNSLIIYRLINLSFKFYNKNIYLIILIYISFCLFY